MRTKVGSGPERLGRGLAAIISAGDGALFGRLLCAFFSSLQECRRTSSRSTTEEDMPLFALSGGVVASRENPGGLVSRDVAFGEYFKARIIFDPAPGVLLEQERLLSNYKEWCSEFGVRPRPARELVNALRRHVLRKFPDAFAKLGSEAQPSVDPAGFRFKRRQHPRRIVLRGIRLRPASSD